MALVFARGLYSAEGQFLGVVCASLASDQFGPALSELDLGSRGTVALRRVDLTLVQQFPPTAGAASSDRGAGIDAMDPLRVAVGQSPVAGYYLASSDGVERSNVYRRVRGYPFYLVGQHIAYGEF